jgi:GNAT superfamily N-acetyltransferase
VLVHPRAQRQGFGGTLYDFLLEQLEPREPRLLVSFTREHYTDAIRFLENRGYKKIMRVPVSRLESATFDVESYAEKLERVANSGIVIKTMAQLREEDPNWKRKLYELEWELVQDVPTPDTLTKQPFEQFENRTLGSPNLLPDAWFVALDGDKYVGMSVLWRNLSTSKLLETGLTGVARSHRRRGIATAMKVHAIRYAQEYGNAAIVTDNEENNPMFQLNLQLGFKPQPAALDYLKEVNQESETEAEELDPQKVVSPV